MTTTPIKMRFGSLRGQLTLWFSGLVLLTLSSVGLYIGNIATDELVRTGGEALRSKALAAASLLSDNLADREKEIYLLSASMQLTRDNLASPDVRALLDQRRQVRGEYSWLGIADPHGLILQSTGGNLLGQNVAQRPWFQGALKGGFAGDVHEAVLLAKLLPNRDPEQPLRFIDFAMPIRDAHGQLRGVLGSHVDWYWVTGLVQSVISDRAEKQRIEVLIVNRQGEILYPLALIGNTKLPATLNTKTAFQPLPWSDGRDYLSSMVELQGEAREGFGWRVVVRQPLETALQPSITLRNQLLLLGLLTAIACAVLAYRFAIRISRPVEKLVQAARAIENGESVPEYPHNTSIREIEQLSQSIQSMTQALFKHEDELKRLNVSLETQVAERTAALTVANLELALLASRDGLTGVHNRRWLDEKLEECLLASKRNGRHFGLLLVDADHFKQINDVHGHQVGDEVLCRLAALLTENVRATDFVTRYGGEEFVVVLPDTDKIDEARIVAEKIRLAVAAANLPGVGHISVSIGVGLSDDSDAAPAALLERTDQALYQAKSSGRNCVVAAHQSGPMV